MLKIREVLDASNEIQRRFSLVAMVATCVNLMCTWEALSRYVYPLLIDEYADDG